MSSKDTEKHSSSADNDEVRSDRTRRRRLIVSIAIAAVLVALLIRAALPLIRFASDVDALRKYVDGKGARGVLVFIGLNYLQALSTLIGAGPLEIAAGSIYGIVKGTILCDISILAGNLTAFLLSRRYGMRFISLFFYEEQVKSVQEFLRGRHKDRLAALIFLMPGMPKDAAAYVLGLTDMSTARFALIVGICRIPGILLTVLSGDAIALGRYKDIVVIVMITAVLYLIGALIVRALRRRKL